MLAWHEAGYGDGPVVVYFHGTASEPQHTPFPEAAETLGIRVLMADRPGYGATPAAPGATLLDIARLVLADLDARGVGRIAMIGWSGGGPHALACAAVAPGRVSAVGLIASWTPMDPPDPGLPAGVRFAMRVAATFPRATVRAMLTLGGQSSIGMVDDVRRVARPWHFDVAHIAATTPVVVWHAPNDRQVPIAPWRAVDGVELNVVDADGKADPHDITRAVWENALRRLAGPEDSPRRE